MYRMIAMVGGRQELAALVTAVPWALDMALTQVVLFIVLRLLLRNRALALVAFFFAALFMEVGPEPDALGLAGGAVTVLVWLVVLLRLGLLPITVGMLIYVLGINQPLTLDMSRWYATSSVLGLVVMVAIAAWGLHVSLAGRSFFADDDAPRPRPPG